MHADSTLEDQRPEDHPTNDEQTRTGKSPPFAAHQSCRELKQKHQRFHRSHSQDEEMGTVWKDTAKWTACCNFPNFTPPEDLTLDVPAD